MMTQETTDTAMTVAGHKKFLFDRDFSPEANLKMQLEAQAKAASEAEPVEIVEETLADVPVTYTEEELAQARAEGFQAGHTEATRDLTSALEQRLTNTMDAINAQVANLFDAFARDKEEHSRDAVAVATVIVRKLFPALNMDKAMAEIEHMIIEAMQRTSGSPTLIIRVMPDIKEAVEAKVAELSALRGREGTVTVMADGALAEGDATIEWDGGGMIRDTALMWQEIDEIIERNLGSKRANGLIRPETETHPDPVLQEPAQEVVIDAAVEDNESLEMESLTDADAQAEPEPSEPALAEPALAEPDHTGDEMAEMPETPETPENSG